MSIGEILKHKRKSLNLTLEEISDDIKVQRRYLEIIENELEKNLDVYVIGYLKIYSNYLNVDVTEHIVELKKHSKSSNHLIYGNELSQNTNIKSHKHNIYSAIFIITIIITAYFLYSLDKKAISNQKYQINTNEIANSISNKKTYARRINNNEYIVYNISEKFFLFAEDSTELELYDIKNNLIESCFLRVGEKKLVYTPHEQVRIKVSVVNSIKID